MKKISKILSVFLAVLMAMSVISCAVSAEEATECAHEFGKWIISKNESCTEDGIKVRQCSLCSFIETDLVKATGHSFDEGVVTEPTCGQKGCTTFTCATCGEKEIKDEKPALEHTYGEWTVVSEPTCTTEGVKTRECSVCDASAAGHTQTEVIPANGHNLLAGEVIEPTYTDEGYTIYKCEFCDYTENKDYTPVLKGKVLSVKLDIDSVTVNYEQAVTVTPTIDVGGSVDYTVYYISAAENVATVDENGVITGKGMGKTTITCKVIDEYGNVVETKVNVQVKFTLANWFTLIRQILKVAIDVVIGGLFGSLIK